MDDDELQSLRAQRLAELQRQNANPSQMQQKQSEAMEEQKIKEAEFKNHILSQVLSQEARARLNTLSVAKPSKAAMVENLLINMVRMGQIQGKLQECDLINLLEKVSDQTNKKAPTVKFDRRRTALDSDDEY